MQQSHEGNVADPTPSSDPPSSEVRTNPSASSWQPGTVIANLYEVKEPVRSGAMGLVHRVYHRQWKRELAVKTPSEEVLQAVGGRERFQEREAYEWVRLGLHPNITSCFYVRILTDGLPHIFIEYVDGGTLAEWLEQGKVTDLATALDICIQICWGLGWAHKRPQPLVHRDVKPANVLMTRAGIPKVTDFGLVKPADQKNTDATEEAGPEHLSSKSSNLGTPRYGAPEQWTQAARLTPAADVYAVGMILYEMLAPLMRLDSYSHGDPEILSTLIADELKRDRPQGCTLSDAAFTQLAQLLRRCLADQPQDRYSDATMLASELQTLYAAILGQPYPREIPDEVQIEADSLNNQALSLLDLGKPAEAEKKWEEALEKDPQHLETTFNYRVEQWRKGKLTDAASQAQTDALLVHQLTLSMARYNNAWQVRYLLALVHLERGDVDAALALLEEVAEQLPGEEDIRQGLKQAHSAEIEAGRCIRTFTGHTGAVLSVCLSANGLHAFSAGIDKTIRLWDTNTGECLRIFTGHADAVCSISLSADGRQVVSGSWDTTIRLWDVSTGRCLRFFKGHQAAVSSVCLSADGRWILSGGEDRTVRLWEVDTGDCLIFHGHRDYVAAVWLSPDGGFSGGGLAGGRNPTDPVRAGDTAIRRWDVGTSRCLQTIEGHEGPVVSICSSADSLQRLLSGSLDRTVRVWDADGTSKGVFRHPKAVSSIATSADGRWVLSGSMDRMLRLWEIETGRCLRTFEGHIDEVLTVALSADGRRALSGSVDTTVRLWAMPSTSKTFCTPRLSDGRSYAEMAKAERKIRDLLEQGENALRDGDYATALKCVREARAQPGGERVPKGLELWRKLALVCRRVGLRATRVQMFEGHQDAVRSVCLSRDGKQALSGSMDQTLRIWETAARKCIQTIEVGSFLTSRRNANPVCWSADSRFILSASGATLHLWDAQTRQHLRTFRGHRSTVNAVCLSADGRFALSGSGSYGPIKDNTVRLWEVATGRCLQVFRGHGDWVNAVCLSADGRYALSGSIDRRLARWDVASGLCIGVFEGHQHWVNAVCLSADGRYALSGSEDKTLRLWDLDSVYCIQSYEGHTGAVNSVSMSADGRFAVSGSHDNTVRLWKINTTDKMRCLSILEGHSAWVASVSLSADGLWALSGSADKTLRLWELDWELEAHGIDNRD